jgi:hypothetical protein
VLFVPVNERKSRLGRGSNCDIQPDVQRRDQAAGTVYSSGGTASCSSRQRFGHDNRTGMIGCEESVMSKEGALILTGRGSAAALNPYRHGELAGALYASKTLSTTSTSINGSEALITCHRSL